MHNDFSTLFEDIWMKYKIWTQATIVSWNPVIYSFGRFFMAKRNSVFAILLLVWGKGKKWSHFYVQSS